MIDIDVQKVVINYLTKYIPGKYCVKIFNFLQVEEKFTLVFLQKNKGIFNYIIFYC